MKYLIEEATLTGIADAVREKKGTTDLIQVSNLATEISNIQGGGTVEELIITSNGTYNPPTGIDGFAPVVVNVPQDGGPPESAFNITGDCEQMFINGNWNWFLETYGNRITMNNIGDANMCFQSCDTLTSLPINSINFKGNDPIASHLFRYCRNMTEFPRITITGAYYSPSFDGMFDGCNKLRELPYDYFTSMMDDWDTPNLQTSNGSKSQLFADCFCLREHPDLKCLGQKRDYAESLYKSTFRNCYTLNKAILPVSWGEVYYNRCFSGIVENCNMLKDFTFITNEDGTPITTGWKSQTIDLTYYVGYAPYASNITGYNSGITADKRVKDDATYQALKYDPDWFSTDINYSRYNHNSAVNTINSLPDASAYLATAGGTNTIMFKGASGASTDGGAINTLTEEEIAVATAKGWTVSLV